MNKDNVFNLYMNTRHIFKYEYPNFKFDIRDIKENDNATERVLIGTSHLYRILWLQMKKKQNLIKVL